MPPAEVYIHGHDESVLRSHRWRTIENSAAYLSAHLSPGLDVLDVGCGPGTITVELAERVAPGAVVGIDRSEEVIAEARTLDGHGARFEVGDLSDLRFDDASFDVVHAHQVLQHVSDPVGALRELRRVCRRNGIVAARDADYASFSWAPLDPRLDDWLATYRQVARANRAEPDAGRHLLGWAHAAGFTDVRVTASIWCFATPEDRAWWGGLWADRMRSSRVPEQAIAHGISDRPHLDASATAFEEWAGDPDGWFAVPHGEIVARR